LNQDTQVCLSRLDEFGSAAGAAYGCAACALRTTMIVTKRLVYEQLIALY